MSKGKLLIIGAGGVGAVSAHKAAQMPEVFSEITVASRSMARPERIRKEIQERYERDIRIEQVDADHYENVAALLRTVRPDVVIHNALGYQNFPIMNACLEERVNYIDTATPEVRETPGFTYHGQWDMFHLFEKAGILGVLGIGFDPGVTDLWPTLLTNRYFNGDKRNVEFIDIVDCNAGDHHQPFATNFDPEINGREVNLSPRYWVRNKNWRGWLESPCITEKDAVHFTWDAPGVGAQEVYQLYHDDLEPLFKIFPDTKRGRFFMSFSENPYLVHMRAFKKYGLISSTPIEFKSERISPREMMARIAHGIDNDPESKERLRKLGFFDAKKIEFPDRNIRPISMFAAVLPKPDSLAAGYTGKTSICDIVRGNVDGVERRIGVYNVKDHHECYLETGQHGISYTAGVPPVIAAEMIVRGYWRGAGVFNPGEMNPEPFIASLDRHGLPSVIEEDCTRKLID